MYKIVFIVMIIMLFKLTSACCEYFLTLTLQLSNNPKRRNLTKNNFKIEVERLVKNRNGD